jgi:hypothetical protein
MSNLIFGNFRGDDEAEYITSLSWNSTYQQYICADGLGYIYSADANSDSFRRLSTGEDVSAINFICSNPVNSECAVCLDTSVSIRSLPHLDREFYATGNRTLSITHAEYDVEGQHL